MPIRNKPTIDVASRIKRKATGPASPVNIQLPEAHPRQYELINAFELRKEDDVRFVVGACGTKFGA